jgi:hypothetical protein
MIRMPFRRLLILTSVFALSLHAVALEHNSTVRE